MATKKTQALRGPALRRKIEDSREKGESYRSEHQGADALDTNIKHDPYSTRARTINEHTKK